MVNCPKCKSEMKPLFTGWFCPKDCDKPESHHRRLTQSFAGGCTKWFFMFWSHRPKWSMHDVEVSGAAVGKKNVQMYRVLLCSRREAEDDARKFHTMYNCLGSTCDCRAVVVGMDDDRIVKEIHEVVLGP